MGWALLLAVLVRMSVAVATPGHQFDLGVYAQWAQALRDHSLSDFYRAAGDTVDHLPGDLYLHRLLVGICSTLGITPGSHGYVLALKLVANLADLAAAALAWTLVRRQRPHDPRAVAITAAAALLTPSTIVLAAAWGQWDMVSVVFFLAGAVLLGRDRWWWLGPALFAWSCLIKPQFGLAVIALLAVWLLHLPRPTAIRRAVASAVIGVVTVLALGAPFSVGLPALGVHWSLPGRLAYASNLYPCTTLGAPNIWQLHPGRDDATWAGLTYRTIGHMLLIVTLTVLAIRLYRARKTTNWLGGGMWLAALAMWAFYICETRSHERYLVPATALMLVHAGLA